MEPRNDLHPPNGARRRLSRRRGVSIRGEHEKAAILGGGIGGLACALALHRAGVECTVHERANELREIGAGLLLSPNACAVIRALGLLPALAARAVETPAWDLLDAKGGRLSRILACHSRDDVSLSTRRTDLHEVLLSALPPGTVTPGREAMEIRAENERVCVRFGNGSSLETPLLIAADGSQSVVRKTFQPSRVLRFQGYVGWRSIVTAVPAGWEHGRVTESWGRGKRFGIAPVGGGRCYWYATTNEPFTETHADSRREHLLREFTGWHQPVRDLIAASTEGEILRHPISDTLPPMRWSHGARIALLGDAAHTLTPNLGQGCAMALEDAWTLAQCLSGSSSTTIALRRYEIARRARLAMIWAASRASGLLIQWENPLLCALRDFSLRCTPDALATFAMCKLLGFQIARFPASLS